MNSATLVLPLVPVTATAMRGCAPYRRAAMSANARRGSSDRSTGMATAGNAASLAARMATAPLAAASGTNCVPSALVPASAAKTDPGTTLRLSAVMAPASTASAPAGTMAASAASALRDFGNGCGMEPARVSAMTEWARRSYGASLMTSNVWHGRFEPRTLAYR